MAHVTLIMTRKPIDERFFRSSDKAGKGVNKSALFSSMAVVVGPKITGATVVPAGASGGQASGGQGNGSIGSALKRVASTIERAVDVGVALASNQLKPFIILAEEEVQLQTDGTPITKVIQLDAMERYRGDNGKFGAHGFMLLNPRPSKPYPLTLQEKNSAVAQLTKDHGKCLKVHDHGKVQQGTKIPAGILVHEAPHCGWLTGCVSPRLKSSERKQSHDRTPSSEAMRLIFEAMGADKTAALIVLT